MCMQFLSVFFHWTGNSLVECRLHPHLGGVVTGGMVAEAVKGAGDIAHTSFSLLLYFIPLCDGFVNLMR